MRYTFGFTHGKLEPNKDLVSKAVEFVAYYEGLELEAYPDAGMWAICYGNRSKKGETTTKKDCDDRLRARVLQVSDYVDRVYNRDFNENQKIALISFNYNVKNYQHVRWRVNNGYSDQSVANSMRLHNKSQGVELPGLVARRNAEYHLFLKPLENRKNYD